ncbi:MOSC domain-containing protein [Mesorhizobium sp. YM1C-6-2]|uniref:MOSC domain-containing protein n=1 Tax=Mesorhizobium sp. YM1C-6-2 TaxID=1827501 RepID=UPI000EF276F8|nr:MOSC domain-containing protein [Mesorhizobium sp. YM1C-6-2]RLP26038.1 MOSC domain-containing protein [Mesorhizobium sp. YM1C-6-2]
MNEARQDGAGRVAGLWRYPASSLGGESLSELAVGTEGADGDRLFGLVDIGTGEIARPDTNQKWHGVPRIAGRLVGDGRLEIRTPGGDWLAAPGEAADRAASAFLGFDASIRPFRGPGADGDGVPFSPRYQKAPIHLLTTASLAELKAQHPAGDPDPRRFRPNILVDMPPVAGHFPETEWLGRKIAIGELELAIADPCRRCGFTIIAQEGFANDPDILRTLVRKNAHNLGVYCTVTRPGRVRMGDAMRLIA